MIRVALSGRVARSEGAHEVCDQVGDGENRDEVRQGGGKGLGEEEETRDNVISDMDKYKEEGRFHQVQMTNLNNQHFPKLLADQLL